MTESEWLAATDPEPMLAFLRGKASERKLRLFACACCRGVCGTYDQVPTANRHILGARALLDACERHADAAIGDVELAAARAELEALRLAPSRADEAIPWVLARAAEVADARGERLWTLPGW